MKLLTMPHRNPPAATATNVLPQVWATEGNLATAVAVMSAPLPDPHTGCAPRPDSRTWVPGPIHAASAEPAPRSPWRVIITPRTAFYRKYTEGLLRRYGVASLHKGRIPSLLGRELFRGRASSYRMCSFEDVIIFVADVERCLKLLTPDQQRLVVRVAVQEYTLPEAASLLRWSLRSAKRRYYEAIDELTAIFQQRRLLEPDPGLADNCGKLCQEGEEAGVVITFPG